ncbi:hypothetical protein Y032_0042g522 [Ancylostoma ceylanicum]|uniref:Uncharacterized protein n=1 Tax=Ancylostoma ceylanicum TaxID=53326 RepID=A0A016UGM7_9BILA|nr:hypothetical protein Y032_0042g522 [Ancylostoma ceylanicum]
MLSQYAPLLIGTKLGSRNLLFKVVHRRIRSMAVSTTTPRPQLPVFRIFLNQKLRPARRVNTNECAKNCSSRIINY